MLLKYVMCLSFRMTMSSTCVQLCLRYRGFVCSKTSSRWCYSQSHHCNIRTPNMVSLSNGLFTNGSLTAAQTRQRLKQQMCYYNDLTVKYLTTEAKESKNAEDIVRSTDSANPPLMPNTNVLSMPENMNSLGRYSFCKVNQCFKLNLK